METTRRDRATDFLRRAGRRGLACFALFALLGSLPGRAGAAEREPLCLAGPAEATARLDAALWSARVTGACAAAAPLRGRFEERRGAVLFVLVPPGGTLLERAVPWLTKADGALVALDEAGRLSTFAVLVEALLAEQRLPASGADAAAGARRQAPAPPGAAQPRASSGAAAAAAGARQPPRSAGGAATAAAAGATLPPGSGEAAAAEATGAATASATAPAEGATASASDTKLGGAGASALALLSSGAPAAIDPADTLPRAPLPSSSAGAGPALLAPELFAGVRLRLPGLVAPEVGGGLALREFFLHGAYQPEARWSLDGPALAVSSVSFLGGYHLALLAHGPLELQGSVGLAAERLVVTELAAGNTSHAAWDAGAGAGTTVTLRPVAQLGIGLAVLGFWFPTGRSIELPGGAIAHLNGAALRFALTLRWGE